MLANDVLALTDGLDGALSELRRDIHQHPELGLDLPRTQGVVTQALSGLGLDISLGETSTSVTADLPGPEGAPTILLRADMDALPMTEETDESFRSVHEGRAHSCGHDAHVAMLLAAAEVLSAMRSELPVSVRFMFQPGEEGFGGAEHMIDEGVLEGVDRAFALHVTPSIPSGMVTSRGGSFMASADELDIVIHGRGGHASSPHQATDPIPAACSVVTAIQTMVTRDVNALEPGVVTIAQIHAGTTHNVIPPTASLGGTIRSTSANSRLLLHQGIERVTHGVTAAHGCTCDVNITEGYPVTVNNDAEAERAIELASEVLGADKAFELPYPVMGAEDFSYVLEGVPGAMAFLGMCPPDIANSLEAPSNHSNKMRIDESAMTSGVAMHLAQVLVAG